MIQYRVYDWKFDMEKLSETINKLREWYEIAFIAEILGVDHSTVSNWKQSPLRGDKYPHPSMGNFIRFCNEFDLDPRDFFTLVSE